MNRFSHQNCYLGIDIGTVSIGFVVINCQNEVIHTDYIIHYGNINQTLFKKLEQIDLTKINQIGYNHRACEWFSTGISVNDQVAILEGVKFQVSKPGAILIIGGETFGLILLNDNNQYQKFISNSSCAAGTGAFIDQQAERLGLSGSAELTLLADSYNDEPPKIATRCAVFAKTDLIHCQQQGYSINAICAGLCKGLSHNIVDTLQKGNLLREPVVIVGGVSKNNKVMKYLSELIGHSLLIPRYAHLTGALGCALIAQHNSTEANPPIGYSIERIIKKQSLEKHYFYPVLSLKKSEYPDFYDHKHYLSQNVEVDEYHLEKQKSPIPVYLGIDIGSTSTKAVIIEASQSNQVLLGLYTRTLGQPIRATQNLLRALKEVEERHAIQLDIKGVGTTGSGRKFIQKVINADIAIDEITAHAKAAYLLNNKVDTIIEIGGQDSKFTVIQNGNVIFSMMNYVCAAGTGSFIEEQAKRLNIPLQEVATLAMKTPSPLTSDRCTVFMERDINHLLSRGYTKEELLAAVLHSVADNYLSKVAHLNKIGNVICFQGATAKNEALVAVFEQKLQKPILVSKFCHLTGALGVCFILNEKQITISKFRGIDFYKETPIITNEICDLCNNHCKLNRINVANESIVWGYLCGRDEADKKRKPTNQSGFDLLSNHRKIFNPQNKISELIHTNQNNENKNGKRLNHVDLNRIKNNFEINLLDLRHKLFVINRGDMVDISAPVKLTIGLPNTLYLLELLPFWKFFFTKLGYKIYISSSKNDTLKKGRQISGAEFCSPMINWHGHISELVSHADYIFLPEMFYEGEDEQLKFYCYYSNYAVSLIKNIPNFPIDHKSIAPTINLSLPALYNVHQIYQHLPQELKLLHSPSKLVEAFTQAWDWFLDRKRLLVNMFQSQIKDQSQVSVVFLGRPYLIFDPELNKNIPTQFNQLGVKTFFQDMLPLNISSIINPSQVFLEKSHWKFGAHILDAAKFVAQTPGLYPVYLTAFKCSPDSFVIHYFREIMDAFQKPYLILQLDEHGSDIGYGTRVEAAVETFRNHSKNTRVVQSTMQPPMDLSSSFKQKTILIPNYDPICCDLICASFKHAGYSSQMIEETSSTVVSSLRLNDGQCLPVSSIIQGAIETINKYGLKPENTAIFLNALTQVSCNFPQYPLFAKKLLEQRGNGFEKVQIFATRFHLAGLPFELIFDIYCSYLLGGLLRKIGCKLRPYELVTGEVDKTIETAQKRLHQCIAAGESKETVFSSIVNDFLQIPMQKNVNPKPKVAIIGDLYVRDNDIFNQHLIKSLEENGAEVITVPFTYVVRLLGAKSRFTSKQNGKFLSMIPIIFLTELAEKMESRFYQIAHPLLQEQPPVFSDDIFEKMNNYHISYKHDGETSQNVLKIFSLLKHYPDLAIFVHVNPIFCCPGLVSESLFKTIETDIGIPIVSITYDGTTSKKNEILAPFIHFLTHAQEEKKLITSQDTLA